MIERHPEIVYVIAGRTHPDVAHREGEQYRLKLERRVLELDLAEHVEFDDRFLSIDELSDLLAATDVFVTPYRNREQIASGALTFAIAAGCAVGSTPYGYAQDMLASGAGRLVPFDDAAAPPLWTEHGWPLVYHGVKETVSGQLYRVGLALLDLAEPTRVLRRLPNWVIAPLAPYERTGDVPNVVFPCGLLHDAASGEVRTV